MQCNIRQELITQKTQPHTIKPISIMPFFLSLSLIHFKIQFQVQVQPKHKHVLSTLLFFFCFSFSLPFSSVFTPTSIVILSKQISCLFHTYNNFLFLFIFFSSFCFNNVSSLFFSI
ncbi:hypothetical protein BDV25DRAFT_4961 [Aspergillus avenaceus]|uniref:Uncharacterized protein n=1 Tax=Aspergillus avenaceus TaxID=36643 RepID=A0A5N6TST2_ASPAV|nr:hypothetical protein BDV25DRAFT_4961 [Aspergillus avenaceus]